MSHDFVHPDPRGHDGKPCTFATRQIGVRLFDLENDISETSNVAGKHTDVVSRLQALTEECRKDLGDSATGQAGKNVRTSGRRTEKASDGVFQ